MNIGLNETAQAFITEMSGGNANKGGEHNERHNEKYRLVFAYLAVVVC